MGFGDWVENARWYYEHQPAANASKIVLSELVFGAYRRFDPYLPTPGTPVYDLDWDVLILLDTCRPDALESVADEYPVLPESVPTVRSLGSNSKQWMERNFLARYDDDIAHTAYVTFNPNTEDVLDPDDFLLLDEVWRTDWNSELKCVEPRTITDRAIAAHRELNPDRLIVHYQQPHAPYPHLEETYLEADDPTEEFGGRTRVFGQILRGNVAVEDAWAAYLDNLRWVLDDLEILLSNLDAEHAIVSADHGDAFGEWGVYGHHASVPIPQLVRVPWVEVPASDDGTHEPDVETIGVPDEFDLDEKLEALGYR